MEQEILFQYRPSNRITVFQVFLLLALVFIFGCWGSLLISIVIYFLVEILFSTHLPNLIFPIIFIGIVALTIYKSLKTGTRNFLMTTDKIIWENYFRQKYSIDKSDVTNVKFKKGQLHVNNSEKILLPPISNKETIILNSLLLDWFPSNALDEDLLKLRLLRKSIPEENNLDIPTCVIETSRRKFAIFRGVSVGVLSIALFLVLWTFFDDQNGFGVAIGLGLFILFGASVVWVSTQYRAIIVQKDGLLYRRGNKESLYIWENIEVIGFDIRNYRLHLWINEKQKRLSFSQMNTAEVNNLGDVIYRVALIKNIPLGNL